MDNKVEELERRVKALEKKEKKRSFWKLIKFIVNVVVIALVATYIYKGYQNINNKYIKPLKHNIETVENFDINNYIKSILKK